MAKMTVTKLLLKAKAAIKAGEKSWHEAAKLIAAAQEQGASQRDIAAKVGKSVGWVNELLTWHKDGANGSPFTAKNAKAKQRRSLSEQKKAKPALDNADDDVEPNVGQALPKAKLNGKDIDVGSLSPAAQEQLAKALADDEEPEKPAGDPEVQGMLDEAEKLLRKKAAEDARVKEAHEQFVTWGNRCVTLGVINGAAWVAFLDSQKLEGANAKRKTTAQADLETATNGNGIDPEVSADERRAAYAESDCRALAVATMMSSIPAPSCGNGSVWLGNTTAADRGYFNSATKSWEQVEEPKKVAPKKTPRRKSPKSLPLAA